MSCCPLNQAAAWGHLEMVQHLIQKYKCNWQKMNKVHILYKLSLCLGIVQLLILLLCLYYIYVFVQGGWTLLHCAARSGNIELVDWLIKELSFDVHQVTKVRPTDVLSTLNVVKS